MDPKPIDQFFRKVISLNEGGDKCALKFSDPDGVRSGKSGWSFGLSQFDTKNNDLAITCLRELGFTPAEIQGVVNQTIDVKPLEAKLRAGADIIARYDEAQLRYCINKAMAFSIKQNIHLMDTSALLAFSDYNNQYGSMGPGAAAFFKGLNRPVTAEDTLAWKLEHTDYGKKHPGDCKRRYSNIVKVMQEANTPKSGLS